jgi:hypothetical protein
MFFFQPHILCSIIINDDHVSYGFEGIWKMVTVAYFQKLEHCLGVRAVYRKSWFLNTKVKSGYSWHTKTENLLSQSWHCAAKHCCLANISSSLYQHWTVLRFDKCSADVNLMLYETHSVMTIYVYFRFKLILFSATLYSFSCWSAVFKKVSIERSHICGCYCNWLAVVVWAYSLSPFVIYT